MPELLKRLTSRNRRRQTVSILVAMSDGGKTFQRTTSIFMLRLGLVGFAFLCALGLLSIALMIRQVGLRAEIAEARNRSSMLEKQLLQLDQLEEEIVRMQQLGDQVRALAGVPAETTSSGSPELDSGADRPVQRSQDTPNRERQRR